MFDDETNAIIQQGLADIRRILAECVALLTVQAKAYNPNEPRDEHGRWTSGGGTRRPATGSRRKPFVAAATEQRHAEGNRDRLATAMNHGAKAIPGNHPSDIERDGCRPPPCHRHQFELKTLLVNRRGSIRQTSAAQARKLLRLQEGPQPVRRLWTLVVDNRQEYAAGKLDRAQVFPCFVKEGCGSYSVSAMQRVENARELEGLLTTPSNELPEKAKPPTAGFYAEWQRAGQRQRDKMAQAAFARERARVARRKQKG